MRKQDDQPKKEKAISGSRPSEHCKSMCGWCNNKHRNSPKYEWYQHIQHIEGAFRDT